MAPTVPADFPLPGSASQVVVAPAPSAGHGNWAGASSAVVDEDGRIVLAYRIRSDGGRGWQTVISRSDDGERYVTLGTLTKERFGAQSMERPAILRVGTGRWRLYVCCATPDSKHWWIEVLEAARPEDLAAAPSRVAFAGDRLTGVKDPIVRRRPDGHGWEAWVCCHPLDQTDAEDRMTTAYATSSDGFDWQWHGTVLAGRPGMWDARGARLTVILADGRAAYDGRATKEENFFERTGLARLVEPLSGRLEPLGAEPVADVRYLDVLPLGEGRTRIFYEARLPDGSHELRTELSAR